MVDQRNKPFVLFIDSGFKYNISNLYQRKCELLSENYRGKVVTFGDEGRFQFGDVGVMSFKAIMPKMLFSLLFPLCKAYMTLRALAYSLYSAKKYKADLVVTYDPLTTGMIGAIVAWCYRIPLIVEVNGDYTAWSIYSDISNPIVRNLKRGSKVFMQRFTFKRAKGIKILYLSQIDHFEDIVKTKLVRKYPNYLDVREFYQGEERKAISIIGFPFAVKGIDIAIASFKKVADKFPDWSLEILGFFPGNEPQLIDEHIDGHPRIARLGSIDRSKMPEYVGNTGIVLCASRTEGFPRVIKEAMQAGKPCIVSDVGGLSEAIDNRTNGLIFESENVDQLAACMEKLMTDESLRRSFGQEASLFACREYSDDAFKQYAHEFYSKVLG